MKNFFIYFLGIIAAIIVLFYITGYDYLFNVIKIKYFEKAKSPGINDGHIFLNHEVSNSVAQPWVKDTAYNKIKLSKTLLSNLESSNTASFLIIKDGKLINENYWDGNNIPTPTNSFSIASGVTVMLLGKAIEEESITNINEKLTDFYPDFSSDEFGKLCSLRDLSSMQADLKWKDNYSSFFSPTAKAYFSNNLADLALNIKFKTRPGTHFEYQSIASQLLAYVVRKAVNMPLSSYLSQKIWQPLGMESSATWNLDQDNGVEKAFCCINAISRDYAKLGQLLLNDGKWNDTKVLESSFIHKMITGTKLSDGAYGNGIWVNTDHNIKHYFFYGSYGQYIICIPDYNIVIVRTGFNKNESFDQKNRPKEAVIYVDEVVKSFVK